jgi:hypothetical protein
MKYLKSFNESLEDVDSLVKNYLSFILDELTYYINTSNIKYNICIYRPSPKRTSPYLVWSSNTFSWNDIKDDFIPFLKIYREQYKKGEFSISCLNFYTGNDLKFTSDFEKFYTGNDLKFISDDDFEELYTMEKDFNIDNIQIVLNKN